jgi:hypothetical protein
MVDDLLTWILKIESGRNLNYTVRAEELDVFFDGELLQPDFLLSSIQTTFNIPLLVVGPPITHRESQRPQKFDLKEWIKNLGPPSSLAKKASHISNEVEKKNEIMQHHRSPNIIWRVGTTPHSTARP